MRAGPAMLIAVCLAATILVVGLGGCAGARVPAIDPTGRHLFSGASTTLNGLCHQTPQPVMPISAPIATVPIVTAPPVAVTPVLPSPYLPAAPAGCGPQMAPQPLVALPQPACAPAPQPACNSQPVIAVPAPPQCPTNTIAPTPLAANPALIQSCATGGKRAPELRVTPSRIVAPVGSEVLLTAGLHGDDGYLQMRQPLEWMIAQDGVGQIVLVGKEAPGHFSHLIRHSPQKRSPNYVLAHTSTITQNLDRGTPNPSDDVALQRGQSWITVSSPTEGTSHVTVVAPKECDWERHKVTATIYWVDAKWNYPACATARAGDKHLLTTQIVRSSGEPVAGWIVRYEVVDGPEAGFGVTGDRAIEIQTDARGAASAELLPRTTNSGITTIRTLIVRPPTGRGDLPQMVVGQSTTSINWSAPGISVRALGPSVVSADGTVTYRVEVANTGDQLASDVVLSFTPPPGMMVLNSTPSAQPFGQRFEWRVAQLQPRQADVVELNCRTSTDADLRATFRARTADGLEGQDTVATRVFNSALAVRMNGPDAVEVGKQAQFRIEVTNTGSLPLENVTISDVFDPGLKHADGGESPIAKTLGNLDPGETKRFAVTFLVTQPGRQRHRLSVSADGGHTAASSGAVTGIQPTLSPPRLELNVKGPQQLGAGEEGEYILEVTNVGDLPATDVRIVADHGRALTPTVATGGRGRETGPTFLAWQVEKLERGETISRQLNGKLAAEGAASVRFTVTADRDLHETAEVATVADRAQTSRRPIESFNGGRLADPNAPPMPLAGPERADGSLKITVAQANSTISKGNTTTLIILVHNDRAVTDTNVSLALQLPEGLRFEKMTGPTDVRHVTPDGQRIEVSPVAEMRAGERLAEYRLVLQGALPGRHRVQIEARSDRTTNTVATPAEVTVALN